MASQLWVWFVVAAAAVLAVMVVLRLLRSPSGERRPPGDIQRAVPYGIAARPMPEGDVLDSLLPPKVGEFIRESVEPPRGIQQSTYAHYRCGVATVFFELYLGDDADDARVGIFNAKRETDAEFPDSAKRSAHSLKTDPSYFKYAGLMAWTRGRYFFLANAKGGEADLDRFMESFPY